MLHNAKRNLEEMSFFGLSDRRQESEKLFEWTFDIHFDKVKKTESSRADSVVNLLSSRAKKLIEAAEYLDMHLWKHANYIFEKRLLACGQYCTFNESRDD